MSADADNPESRGNNSQPDHLAGGYDGDEPARGAAATRLRLMDAALTLFAEVGIARTSVHAVTMKAGERNKSAVHYHFGNKLGLVEALLNDLAERLFTDQNRQLDEIEARLHTGEVTVREVYVACYSPFMHLYAQPEYGDRASRFLAQMPWQAGQEAQQLTAATFRPMLLRQESLLAPVFSHIPQVVFRQSLALSLNLVIHAITDFGFTRAIGWTDLADQIERRDPSLGLSHLDYILGGLIGADSSIKLPPLKP